MAGQEEDLDKDMNRCAAFQQLEVDYFLGEPNKKLLSTELTEVPILRMYGVSEKGKLSLISPHFCID